MARVGLTLVLVVLAAVLLFHVIGADTPAGAGLAGVCLFLLVTALGLRAPEIRWGLAPAAASGPHVQGLVPVEVACRPPPDEGPLRGVVLLR